jgi:hypothetical protein
MSKRRVLALVLVMFVVLGVGALFGFLVQRLLSRPDQRIYNTATILQEVQTLSQLVTVKYVIEKVVILDDPPQNTLRQLLWDNTRVILVAHGVVKAGIDLSKMQPKDIEVSGKKVKVRLPQPEVTDAYLDEQQTKVLERNTSFLRDFNKDLEHVARQQAVDDIRRAARTSGIFKDADERARAQLKSLFQQLGLEVEFVSK